MLEQSGILFLLGLAYLGAKSKCSFGPKPPETTDLSQNHAAPDTARQQRPAVLPMNAAPRQQVPQQIEMQFGFRQQGPPDGLSQGWEACVDQDGRTYYQNNFTQQTQWEHPAVGHERVSVSGFRFGGPDIMGNPIRNQMLNLVGPGVPRDMVRHMDPALVHQVEDEDATQLDKAWAVGLSVFEIAKVRV